MIGLKADDVVMRQAAHDFLVNGHGEEHVGRRPGNMKEKADAVLQTHLAQFRGERNQVVVMHPDDVIRFDERRQPMGEEAVDAEIPRHLLATIFREIQPIMANRPENPVGEAMVIFFDIGIGQIRECIGDIALAQLSHGLRLVFAARLPRPAHPYAAMLFKGHFQRDRQPAGGRNATLVRNGHTIGNDYETAHAELLSCRNIGQVLKQSGGQGGDDAAQRLGRAGGTERFARRQVWSDAYRIASETVGRAKHRFVGDIIPDRNRASACKGGLGQEGRYCLALVGTGRTDFDHHLSLLDGPVRSGADQRSLHHQFDVVLSVRRKPVMGGDCRPPCPR